MIPGDRLPTIEASRIHLRWLVESDVDALHAVFSDPEVMRFWSTPPHPDKGATRALLAEIHDYFNRQELFQWGVALQDDDTVIGTCTLFRIDAKNRRAEIGYALAREHWRKGYMAEALNALLAFAFDDLDLIRLEADVDPDNAASIRCLERLGFKREGFARERWLVDGKAYDSVLFGLLRREWHRV